MPGTSESTAFEGRATLVILTGRQALQAVRQQVFSGLEAIFPAVSGKLLPEIAGENGSGRARKQLLAELQSPNPCKDDETAYF